MNADSTTKDSVMMTPVSSGHKSKTPLIDPRSPGCRTPIQSELTYWDPRSPVPDGRSPVTKGI